MAIGRPAILVPLPHALDDNQTPNADILAKADAGWRVAQRDLTPGSAGADADQRFSPIPPIWRTAPPPPMPWPRRTPPRKLADVVEQLAERKAA